MANTAIFDIEATDRNDLGKGSSRRLRRLQDLIPGIVYGGSKEPRSISLSHRIIKKALQNEAFYSHILSLSINGESEKVILKALQRHPYKALIQHMDFQRVDMNKPIHMHVPIHFMNEATAPGVVDAGGVISHQMSDIAITCLPKDLPEFIEIDLANMQLDEIIYLSTVTLPKGVTSDVLTHGNDLPVVSIHLPKVIEEEEPETAEAEAEGESAEAGKEASDSADGKSDSKDSKESKDKDAKAESKDSKKDK